MTTISSTHTFGCLLQYKGDDDDYSYCESVISNASTVKMSNRRSERSTTAQQRHIKPHIETMTDNNRTVQNMETALDETLMWLLTMTKADADMMLYRIGLDALNDEERENANVIFLQSYRQDDTIYTLMGMLRNAHNPREEVIRQVEQAPVQEGIHNEDRLNDLSTNERCHQPVPENRPMLPGQDNDDIGSTDAPAGHGDDESDCTRRLFRSSSESDADKRSTDATIGRGDDESDRTQHRNRSWSESDVDERSTVATTGQGEDESDHTHHHNCSSSGSDVDERSTVATIGRGEDKSDRFKRFLDRWNRRHKRK